MIVGNYGVVNILDNKHGCVFATEIPQKSNDMSKNEMDIKYEKGKKKKNVQGQRSGRQNAVYGSYF